MYIPTPLQKLACHNNDITDVACHLAEVTFPTLRKPQPVLDLATPKVRKAELT